MTSKKIRAIGAAVLLAIWVVLIVFAWVKPADGVSDSERRELAKLPALTGQTLLDGSFMSDFEKYTTDQFPLRDAFRSLKAVFNNSVLMQMDNNNLYVVDGYVAEMLYPLEESNVQKGIDAFNVAYEQLIKDKNCKVYLSVIPDKNYYLADNSGHLKMDYEKLFSMMKSGMPYATYIDITGTLDITDYYYTDTHWRQEQLIPTAQVLLQAMGMTAPQESDYTATAIEKPFYGVYHGQSALPLPADTIYTMKNDVLARCKVTNYVVRGAAMLPMPAKIHDMSKQNNTDLYDIFLSGTSATNTLMRIENPKAEGTKELIVFRDSFGSSMVPLLLSDYKAVTLIDLRYAQDWGMLNKYVNFNGNDVLFMTSTLVLNKGSLQLTQAQPENNAPTQAQTPTEEQTPTESQTQG